MPLAAPTAAHVQAYRCQWKPSPRTRNKEVGGPPSRMTPGCRTFSVCKARSSYDVLTSMMLESAPGGRKRLPAHPAVLRIPLQARLLVHYCNILNSHLSPVPSGSLLGETNHVN